MALNSLNLQGRIPFEMEELKGTEQNPVLMFTISVDRNYKKEGEQYPPQDLLRCKVFGQQAKFISEYFSQGDAITIEGEARKDDDYEKDGQKVYGQMYVHVNRAHFPVRGNNTGTKDENSTTAKPKSNPLAGGAKSNPLAGGAKTNPLAAGKKSPLS